jgi:predicted AAA+ superfamily ATPase
MPYIPRHLEPILKRRIQLSRSVFLFGPRQSGKTTLARHALPQLPYVSLENLDEQGFAQKDPKGFLSRFAKGAIVDEAHRCPRLFPFLQQEIDIHKKKYVLTGSQNFLLSQNIVQSLAGRLSILTLLSMSQSEKERRKNFLPFEKIPLNTKTSKNKSLRIVFQSMLVGGYPEPFIKSAIRPFWFQDYVTTYIERDVRSIMQIHQLPLFQRFMVLCGSRSGSVLNMASLANVCGISESQCRAWLGILEQCEIIFFLRPYHKNLGKRVIKSPKLYFNDTGLLCALLGIKNIPQLATHPLTGALYETWVISEIRKNWIHRGEKPSLYFLRDTHGLEVDLILEDGVDLYLFEVKMGQTPYMEMTAPLAKAKKLFPKSHLFLIYGGSESFVRESVQFLPVSCF